jgi:hypothetical protein
MFVAAMAFVWTPYWFNPLAFNWQAVRSDYAAWLLWISSDGGTAAHSWPSWWREEKGYMVRLRLAEKGTVLVRAVVYLGMAYGVTGPDNLSPKKLLRFGHMVLVSGGAFCVLVYGHWLGGCTVRPRYAATQGEGGGSSGAQQQPGGRHGHGGDGAPPLSVGVGGWVCTPRGSTLTRFLKVPAMALLLSSLVVFLTRDGFLLHMLAGLYYALAALYTVGVVCGFSSVAELLRLHDLLVGHAMVRPLFALAALQLPDKIQTWLLYHNALSEGVLIDTILKQARRQQDEAATSVGVDRLSGGGAPGSQGGKGGGGGGDGGTATADALEEMRRMLAQQQLVINLLQRDVKLQAQAAATAEAATVVQVGAVELAPLASHRLPELPHPLPEHHLSAGAISTMGQAGMASGTSPSPSPSLAPVQAATRQGDPLRHDMVFRGAGPVG